MRGLTEHGSALQHVTTSNISTVGVVMTDWHCGQPHQLVGFLVFLEKAAAPNTIRRIIEVGEAIKFNSINYSAKESLKLNCTRDFPQQI